MTSFLPSPFWFIISSISAICSISMIPIICDYPSKATKFTWIFIAFVCSFVFCLGMGFSLDRAPDTVTVVEVPDKCIENTVREYFRNLPDTNKYDFLMLNNN